MNLIKFETLINVQKNIKRVNDMNVGKRFAYSCNFHYTTTTKKKKIKNNNKNVVHCMSPYQMLKFANVA